MREYKTVAILLVDVENAFDNTNRKAAIQIIKKRFIEIKKQTQGDVAAMLMYG